MNEALYKNNITNILKDIIILFVLLLVLSVLLRIIPAHT